MARLVQSVVAASLEAQDLTLDMLQEEARYILGRDVAFTEEQLSQALDPERFVAVRTLPGGGALRHCAPPGRGCDRDDG